MEFIRNNWWYILIIGGFIFMMLRGGGCCGSHAETNHNHSGDGCCGGDAQRDRSDHSSPSGRSGYNNVLADQVTDPVCGMSISPDKAIKEFIDGQTYYFCSDTCRREFLNTRTKY